MVTHWRYHVLVLPGTVLLMVLLVEVVVHLILLLPHEEVGATVLSQRRPPLNPAAIIHLRIEDWRWRLQASRSKSA